MDIKEIINKYKIKEEFKPILNGFFEMKQSVYGIDDTEMEEKIKETMSNIKDIKYTNNKNILASYDINKNEIHIGKNISNQIKKDGLNYTILQGMFHEISHAYDYKSCPESKKQEHIIDGKKTKLKPIRKQGINPIENNNLKTGKYLLLDECLNEAKAQVLLQIGNKSSISGNSSKLKFNAYQELQPIFETLCSVNNMNYLEFLKNIEGKDINEIAQMMSEKNGISKEKTDRYLVELAESSKNIYVNIRNGFLNNKLKENKKNKYINEGFKNYQNVDNTSKKYLDEIDITNKDLRLDKLNIVKNRVNSVFAGKINSNLDMQVINCVNKQRDQETPSYNGKSINSFNLINDSNNKNDIYKNNPISFIQKIKNKFSNNKLMLQEVNPITYTQDKSNSFTNSLESVRNAEEIASIDFVKINDGEHVAQKANREDILE